MIPALLLVGVGWQRRLPVPIPLFAALFQLSGLRIDVRDRDGSAFLIWFL